MHGFQAKVVLTPGLVRLYNMTGVCLDHMHAKLLRMRLRRPDFVGLQVRLMSLERHMVAVLSMLDVFVLTMPIWWSAA